MRTNWNDQPTMSNWKVPTNATCCNSGSNWNAPNATCCVACCNGEEGSQSEINVVGLTIMSLVVSCVCLMAVLNARKREKQALSQAEEDLASQESKEERRRKRKESISNGLIVKEWVPPEDPPVESTEGDQDTSPPGEAVEAPQPPPAPPINSSSPASFAMGSDDCASLAGEEDEMAVCVICLSHFKPQQLVCEPNNSSCQHVFHKDCMVDWLMKRHDNCPMCREVYLLKTV
jgi:hypothetical protein